MADRRGGALGQILSRLVETAFIAVDERGAGEMVYGVLIATLDCAYTSISFDFTWEGSDEGEGTSSEGWAELQANGSLFGEYLTTMAKQASNHFPG